MDNRDLYWRPRRGLAIMLVALGVAFLVGVAATGIAVRHWDRLAVLLHPVAQPAPIVVTRTIPMPAPATAVPDRALANRVATIETRIEAIDARAAAARGDADRAEGLLVAFAARRALDRGEPLGFLEGTLRDRFGGVNPAAVALVIGAGQRPMTLAQLRDGLSALAPTLAAARPGEGWWHTVRRQFGDLVVIHHAELPSSQPDDRLARAEHALDGGQVDVAAAEVARLPGAPQAQAWLAGAHRYLVARDALDRLETAALLAPRAAAAPPTGDLAGAGNAAE